MKRLVPFAIALIPILIIGFNAWWEFPIERYIYSYLTSPFSTIYRPMLVLKLVYLLYFFLAEALLGQTPGQSLTNSCPVGLRSPMSVRKALLRSLGRLIPFDRFSFLWGKNWHDRVSGTTVARRNSWKDIPFEGERL